MHASGGNEGPAARAAALAARAGAAASDAGGWAAIGGAERMASALHELVTLPLQVLPGRRNFVVL